MIVHTPTQSLVLRVQDPQRIANIIQKARYGQFPDGHNLAVRHGLDEVRILRNLGVAAPPPILYYYGWPIQFGRTPFKHQKETAAFCTLHRRCFVLNEPGTAKTVPILWAADYLMSIGQVHKALIVAPLSTLDLVWATEIFGVLMHRTCAVLHGTRERRLELLGNNFDFYIINHHGLQTIGKHLEGRNDIDLVIVDESAEYRNSSTTMYKRLAKTVGAQRRLWMVTGTPCPKAPTDAWAQARLVNPAAVPPYFGHWKRQTMMQVSTHRWIPRADSYEMAYKAMQPGIRFKKKECLDLPPLLYEKRKAELSDEQAKAYKTMKNQMVMLGDAGTITAVNAADRVNKLRQILCGAIKRPGTNEYEILDHNPRLKVLMECIEQASAKAIVIAPFKGIIRALQEEIAKECSVEVINGDVSKTQRDAIITRFKMDADPHVLLCHPKVMAHGLNLTEADRTIFYAPIFSNNEDQQVIERFNRPGQTRNMTLVQIGTLPLEWEIYKLVAGQKLGQESMLSLYKNELMVV